MHNSSTTADECSGENGLDFIGRIRFFGCEGEILHQGGNKLMHANHRDYFVILKTLSSALFHRG